MSDKILIAKIVAAHGIKGEVKVKSFTIVPEEIVKYNNLYDRQGNVFPKINKKGVKEDIVIAKIDNINDRNQAERMVGTEIYICSSQLPEIKQENEYYYHDLIGLNVLDEQNVIIGTVKAIFNFGAGDIVELKINQTEKLELYPFTKEIFTEVNVSEKYLKLSLPGDF